MLSVKYILDLCARAEQLQLLKDCDVQPGLHVAFSKTIRPCDQSTDILFNDTQSNVKHSELHSLLHT